MPEAGGGQRTQAALDVLQQNGRIDLLLTDIVMPGGNGRELAKQAAFLRPDVRVLFMTGYSRNAVVHQGRLEEGYRLIAKRSRASGSSTSFFRHQNSPAASTSRGIGSYDLLAFQWPLYLNSGAAFS